MLNKIYTAGYMTLSVAVSIAVIMLGISGLARTRQVDAHAIQVAEASVDSTITTADAETDNSIDEAYYDGLIKLQRSYEETDRTMRTSVENVDEQSAMILSEKDYDALIRIVEAEATDEDIQGKIMVANVVFNRVASSGFANTIYDVIHEKCNGKYQFSPLSDGRYDTVPITDSTITAVERALKGEDYAKGALFFMQRSLASNSGTSWFDNNLTKVAEHGCHEFYTY